MLRQHDCQSGNPLNLGKKTTLELITELSKIIRCKIHVQKSIVFEHTIKNWKLKI